MLPVLAPELVPLADTPQDPEWHPEGDVWTHTLLAMDQAAPLLEGLDRPRALAVMLATLAHDLGKPSTTRARGRAGCARTGTRRRACRWPMRCSTAGACTRWAGTTCAARCSGWWAIT